MSPSQRIRVRRPWAQARLSAPLRPVATQAGTIPYTIRTILGVGQLGAIWKLEVRNCSASIAGPIQCTLRLRGNGESRRRGERHGGGGFHVSYLPLGGRTTETNSACPSKYAPSGSDEYLVRFLRITRPQSNQLVHGERPREGYGRSVLRTGCCGYSSLVALGRYAKGESGHGDVSPPRNSESEKYLPRSSSTTSRLGCSNSQHSCICEPQRPPPSAP